MQGQQVLTSLSFLLTCCVSHVGHRGRQLGTGEVPGPPLSVGGAWGQRGGGWTSQGIFGALMFTKALEALSAPRGCSSGPSLTYRVSSWAPPCSRQRLFLGPALWDPEPVLRTPTGVTTLHGGRIPAAQTFTFHLFCSPKSIPIIFMNLKSGRKESCLDPSLLVLSLSNVLLSFWWILIHFWTQNQFAVEVNGWGFFPKLTFFFVLKS